MKKTSAICPKCGNEFVYYPSAYKGKAQEYCSRACRSAASWLHKNCLMCGKEFVCRKCEPHDCCSKTCARRWLKRDRRVTFQCDQCGVEVTRGIQHYRPHAANHFCSLRCWGDWLKDRENPARRKRIARSCKQCGKEFEITPSQLIFVGYGTFCSTVCKGRFYAPLIKHQIEGAKPGPLNINWKGGYKKYYGPNWRQQRREARKRDGYTCVRCGITEIDLGIELDVHHIQPFREFGLSRYQDANDLDNLVSLCALCHKFVEPRGCIK